MKRSFKQYVLISVKIDISKIELAIIPAAAL